MDKKKIIVINLGWEQEPLLDELNNKNLDIYGIHYNQECYKKVSYKDILVTDIRDLEQILKFVTKVNPDYVISDQCDYSYFAQSLIADKFDLIGSSIEQAQVSTNKYLQRVKSKENNINIPDFKLCYSIKDVHEFAKKNGFPIITKPIDNRGSFGVNKIETNDDIEYCYYQALINSHSRLVIVEDFIDGNHITVDGYCFKNNKIKSLALATKKLIGGKSQVAIDINYPGELESHIYDKAMKYNEEVNTKLGFNFGMLHSEYMIRDNEIYLIETANRGGGVYTSELIVPNVSGINILKQYVSDILGLDEDYFKEDIEKNNVILKFLKFESGKIKLIKGLDEISSNKDVIKYRLNVKKGDYIEKISSDANRHGFIIFKSENDIRSKINNIINKIEVVYE